MSCCGSGSGGGEGVLTQIITVLSMNPNLHRRRAHTRLALAQPRSSGAAGQTNYSPDHRDSADEGTLQQLIPRCRVDRGRLFGRDKRG
jgi:hypothetical protein